MTPEIIDRDAFIVVGVRTVLEFGTADVGAFWRDRFLPRHAEIKAVAEGYYCVFNFLPQDPDGRIEYVAGMITDSLEGIPVGMVGWVVPAGAYAEVAASGKGAVAVACRDIVTEWLPDSGYQSVPSPMFAYTKAPNPDAETATWMVNIPVETPEKLERYKSWLGEN